MGMSLKTPSSPPAHQPSDGARAHRRRGAQLEGAILDAAWAEIAEVGYAQATMDGIAKRARTNKATLYRRWPHRNELLAAAIDRRVTPLEPPIVESGEVRADAITILETMRHRCEAIRIVPDETGELAAYVRDQAAHEAIIQMEHLLHEAVRRGEIITVTPLISRLPVDVLYGELALVGEAQERLVVSIVDDLLLPILRNR